MKSFLRTKQKCLNNAPLLEQLKSYQKPHAKTVAWSCDMEGHARKCVERYCELENKEEQLCIVSSPCLGDHQCKQEELESVGDILWSVNKFARAVTKWTQACDRRLARLISHVHHTSDYRQYCHVGNTAQHCRMGFFQDSDFAGDFEDSEINLGERSLEAEHCSPSVGCARSKRQYPTVPQNLKLCRRMQDCEWMDYLLSTLGDVVIEVLRSPNNTARPSRLAQGNLCGTGDLSNSKTRTKNIN